MQIFWQTQQETQPKKDAQNSYKSSNVNVIYEWFKAKRTQQKYAKSTHYLRSFSNK